MWHTTHFLTVDPALRSAIWAIWADVDRWHEWDLDLEFARLDGTFAAGQTFTLRPKGGPTVPITLLRADAMQGYTDLTRFPGARMYGVHDMRETRDGLELVITIRIEGPLAFLWRRLVAQKVADEAPAQLRALAARAGALRAGRDGAGSDSHRDASVGVTYTRTPVPA